ncbi:hypothetical protein PSP20601_05090 [Pandoraea sputorum]|nr:hypothetical protein PSP20601_05090 [Pandoraea sputorum]
MKVMLNHRVFFSNQHFAPTSVPSLQDENIANGRKVWPPPHDIWNARHKDETIKLAHCKRLNPHKLEEYINEGQSLGNPPAQ